MNGEDRGIHVAEILKFSFSFIKNKEALKYTAIFAILLFLLSLLLFIIFTPANISTWMR